MDIARRRQLARDVLAGYVSGPAAATQATARALARVEDSRAIVLVEGISDQIALETLAARRGRDLDAEGVVILPVGGAQATVRYLSRFGPRGTDVRLAGLCDAGEEDILRRSLAKTGFSSPKTRADMERLGFHVCVRGSGGRVDSRHGSRKGRGTPRFSRRPRFVPPASKAACLAGAESRGPAASISGQWRPPEAPPRASTRGVGRSRPHASSVRRRTRTCLISGNPATPSPGHFAERTATVFWTQLEPTHQSQVVRRPT